jgi:hypothetical protein
MRHITPALLLATGVICTPAYANSVVPNFTKGTINATTESTTTVESTVETLSNEPPHDTNANMAIAKTVFFINKYILIRGKCNTLL